MLSLRRRSVADPLQHPLHRRFFVGPILDKTLEQLETKTSKRHRHSDEPDANIAKFVRDHAFAFFVQSGGDEEDWEDKEEGVRQEMFRRWRESEWAHIRRRKQDPKAPKWIGNGFEVGTLLGVNILSEPAESVRMSASRSTRTGASSSHLPLSTHAPATARSYAATSFFTAPAPSPSTAAPPSGLLSPFVNGVTEDLRRTQSDFGSPPRPTFDTALPLAQSDSQVPQAKVRAVHYAEEPSRDSPAPPSEVLERSLSDIPDTSAAAAVSPSSPGELARWEDFTLRDRMLVKFGYTKADTVGPVFDETTSRTMRGIRYDDWTEFIVQWRGNFIQFYEPHNIPGTRWISGTKYRLAHIIPLKSTDTKLSLYSFGDLTFCLTCPPAEFRTRGAKSSRSRALFRRTKEGTNIFICKVKSRTRAADWMWAIWRRLGGTLPPTIDVRNPALETHVKIEIPEPRLPGQDAPEMFSRENIIRLVSSELRRVSDWDQVIATELAQGKKLELVWRFGTQLDWVREDSDVRGQPRMCAVLCGMAMQQSYPAPQLELRVARHVQQHLVLKNGTHISEPPSIEGYVERIRPNSQTKTLVYLVSHEGNLFSLNSEHAQPPSPVGIDPLLQTADALRLSEVQRGTRQILDATGVVDVRSILAVRRAFQPTVPTTHDTTAKQSPAGEDESFVMLASPVERSTSDDEDEGGEDPLRTAQDKPRVKMKRSFELLLKNGHVIRFEAHSRKVALEWVERLRALIAYWQQRHRIDAAEEMDLAQAYRPRLTPKRLILRNDSAIPPDAPIDVTAPLPNLSNLYNACTLEACKPITRGGRLYVRHGFYGQYQFVQLFLLPGHLVQFRISPKSSLHLAVNKKISLADAYVCSGFIAASSLPNGQYNADDAPLPRRYHDGLETDDPDEDTMFILWYHPHKAAANIALRPLDDDDEDGEHEAEHRRQDGVPRPPMLGSKCKAVVFRCRNRLERDTWCWALNCEIEKLARVQREREEEVRNAGGALE
ncbi:hypothetical protein MKEN_00899900 [Mycena kentingensis (nom. inval.)]|nr:hypothetical protein MKEN_00899900 [Mycena kentingensis (nom. inval.)]